MTVIAIEKEMRAIDLINETLQGPVVEILQELLPQLRPLTREEAYDQIMDSPRLAAQCVREFRAHPEKFRTLLVDGRRRPVTRDDMTLHCGRTLGQVVTLIVRAVARRHFRNQLGGRRAAPQPSSGFLQSLLGRFKSVPRPPRPTTPTSHAETLYQAFRGVLLFEWQLELIPHYARMPIALVRRLGMSLLHYKEAGQIEGLIDGTIQPESAPAYVSHAAAGGQSGRANASKEHHDLYHGLSQRIGLPQVLGCDEWEAHYLVDLAGTLGKPVLTALTEAGLLPPEALIGTCTVIQRLTPSNLAQLLASGRQGPFLAEFAQMTRKETARGLKTAAEAKRRVDSVLDQLSNRGGLI